MGKSVYIKTYGCQMNVYDSDRMTDILAPLGYCIADAPEEADLVVLNTCHIREKAAEKVYSELGRLAGLKGEKRARGNDLVIAVGGCVAQAEGRQILDRAECVDLVFGPQTYHRLPNMLERVGATGERVVETEFPAEDKFDFLPEESRSGQVSRFLTIQEGCDKFCTFCVVPYTRGAEQSRNALSIYAEAERLVADGARELTLLGQNVNAWHGDGPDGDVWGLGRLIVYLSKIEGLDRIRYTTSHPRDMDDELIEAHGAVGELMPFLHLPVQSGSDSVLAAMNRRHTADDYRRIVERLRASRRDLALSSDFIVGYPGETDADFDATMALVEEIGFVQAYSFKYSPRPGTPAADAGDQVPEPVKTDRLAALQALLRRQQDAFLAAQMDMELDVLFEGPGRYSGQMIGRSPYMQPVFVETDKPLGGTLRRVRINTCLTNSLKGELVSDAPRAAQVMAEGGRA